MALLLLELLFLAPLLLVLLVLSLSLLLLTLSFFFLVVATAAFFLSATAALGAISRSSARSLCSSVRTCCKQLERGSGKKDGARQECGIRKLQ